MGLIYQAPSRAAEFGAEIAKTAAAKPVATYALSGRLYKSDSGWILLSVPNSLVRGAFDAMDEQGVELPPGKPSFSAHISVMRPEELEQIGGADKVTERGHTFRYQLGKLKSVSPAGWKEMSKVWFIEVKSPELEKLRKSYGLSARPKDNEFAFHITVAVRRKKVLQQGEVSKAAAAPFWSRAALAQLHRPAWQSGRPWTSNLLDNMFQTWRRGQEMVASQDIAKDMASSQNPQARLARLQSYLTHGDFVQDPVDRMLFRPWPL